jgi:SAM-dependent methyltransferase
MWVDERRSVTMSELSGFDPTGRFTGREELSGFDPTGRFTGREELYSRYRPGYPDEMIDLVIGRAGLAAGGLLVDVGCGTGLSSRQFAARGVEVLGVEPNAAMRRQAEQAGGQVRYVEGKAEATGLPDGVARAVLAAQAFHWFDAAAALREFHRILAPAGWAALAWNERDEGDACTAAYGDVIRLAPDAKVVECARADAGRPLLECELFAEGEVIELGNAQELDEEGLLGRAFSASYVPREPPLGPRIKEGLREVFGRFRQGGKVRLCYRTTLYLARRRR